MNSRFLFSALAALTIGTTAQAMNLKIADIKDGATIADKHVFNGMGCSGQNVSPELSWSGAPKDTKAFAVTVYDPDAPTGSGWWHWVVFNLPPTMTSLSAGAGSQGGKLPSGAIQSRTDFGKTGYGGPCPPPGDKPHRYIFTVYALKDMIPLKEDAPAAMVGFYLNQMKLATSKVTGKYGR